MTEPNYSKRWDLRWSSKGGGPAAISRCRSRAFSGVHYAGKMPPRNQVTGTTPFFTGAGHEAGIEPEYFTVAGLISVSYTCTFFYEGKQNLISYKEITAVSVRTRSEPPSCACVSPRRLFTSHYRRAIVKLRPPLN